MALLVLAGWLVLGLVFVATVVRKDSSWALHAYRFLEIQHVALAAPVYLVLALLLPTGAVLRTAWWLAGNIRPLPVSGVVLGLGVAITVNHALLALPDAGPAVAAPGMAAALSCLGDQRLSVVLGAALAGNLLTYAIVGLVASNAVAWTMHKRTHAPALHLELRHRARVLTIVGVFAVVVATALWHAGPGGDGVRAFLARFELMPGVSCRESQVFSTSGDRTLRLDWCAPEHSVKPVPLVVCVHGGGWHGGTRDECFPLLVRLARQGFAAVAPDYRLAPEHRFPAQWDDLQSALAWMISGRGGVAVDGDRVAAVGWSAGGHLASLLGTGIAQWPTVPWDSTPRETTVLHAVVALSPLTNLTSPVWRTHACAAGALLGCAVNECPDRYRAASPLHEATVNCPPFLLIHGAADSVVPVEQSQSMAQTLRTLQVEVSLVEVPGQAHRWNGQAWRDAYDAAQRFLSDKLSSGLPPPLARDESGQLMSSPP